MSSTSFCSNKMPSLIPVTDTENFHEQDFYAQCLDVLMYVGVGTMLFAFAKSVVFD